MRGRQNGDAGSQAELPLRAGGPGDRQTEGAHQVVGLHPPAGVVEDVGAGVIARIGEGVVTAAAHPPAFERAVQGQPPAVVLQQPQASSATNCIPEIGGRYVKAAERCIERVIGLADEAGDLEGLTDAGIQIQAVVLVACACGAFKR